MTTSEMAAALAAPDAEYAVIGALMVQGDLHDIAAGMLTANDFHEPNCRRVWTAIGELRGKGEPVDKISVAQYLRSRNQLDGIGGLDFLTALLNSVPTTASLEYYASVVLIAATRRNLLRAASKLGQLANNPSLDSGELEEQATRILDNALDHGHGQEFVPIAEASKDWLTKIEARKNRPSVSLPFSDLERALGGVLPGAIYVLGGRPGHGKSAFALNLAAHVAKGRPVAYAALEEGADAMVDRHIAMESGVWVGRIISGRVEVEDYVRIAGALGEIADSKLALLGDEESVSIAELRSALRRFKHRNPDLAFAVIDHSTMLRDMDTEGKQSRTNVIEIGLKQLKRMAADIDIPVLLLVHLNRTADDRKNAGPQAQDILHSDAYDQIATGLMALWLPSIYDQTEDPKLMRLRMLKNRYGPFNTEWDFHADLATNRVRQLHTSEGS
jgi:replicative DNA helicase